MTTLAQRVRADILNEAVNSIVAGKVFPTLAPQSVSPPYVVYSIVGSVNQTVLSGESQTHRARVQIACYGGYAECQELSALIETALTDVDYVHEFSRDTYIDSERLNGVVQQFIVFHP